MCVVSRVRYAARTSTRIEYLGLIISKNHIEMDPVKVAVVTDWPEPSNKREEQSFLRFVNFYLCLKVRSGPGLFAKFGKTEDRTGPLNFTIYRTVDRTDVDRSTSVRSTQKTGLNQSKPTTGLDWFRPVLTGFFSTKIQKLKYKL